MAVHNPVDNIEKPHHYGLDSTQKLISKEG